MLLVTDEILSTIVLIESSVLVLKSFDQHYPTGMAMNISWHIDLLEAGWGVGMQTPYSLYRQQNINLDLRFE